MCLPFFLWRCTIVPFMNHQEIIERMRGYIRSLWRLEQVSHIWAANILDTKQYGTTDDAAYIDDLQAAIDAAQDKMMEYDAARGPHGQSLRDAVHLIDFLGYSLDEAAAELHASREAVSRREKRGLLDIALVYLQAAGVSRDWMQAPRKARLKY